MSRIGKAPIPLPTGVSAELRDHELTVKGPKGELSRRLPAEMEIAIADNAIVVRRPSDSKAHRSLHGLTRTLAANMVRGVSEGYVKALELYGVGFRVQLQGQRLNMQLGFSHPVVFDLLEGITAEVEAFVDAVQKNKPVPVPGEEAVVTQTILDAVYKSAKLAREVRIR